MAATREDIRTILRQLFVRNMTSANADQAAERFLDLYFSDDAIDMSDAEVDVNTLTAANGVTATAGGVTATAGGVTATAGGVTATAGGLTATAGGLTVTAGGADISGDTTLAGDTTLTGASPLVTLHNTTNEDTDEGRESSIKFRGQQSGGEESILASIEGKHEGTSDDQKGNIMFFVNDGADANTPTEVCRMRETLRTDFFGDIFAWADIQTQSGSPLINNMNSTASDADGGRASSFTFQGSQSGAEVSTLGSIAVAHDGAADDQKGKITIALNDGADANTPTEALSINAAGVTKIASGLVVTAGGTTVTAGDLIVTAGELTMTDGNAVLTSGDLTLTAGNALLTLGDAILTDGDLTLSSGNVAVTGTLTATSMSGTSAVIENAAEGRTGNLSILTARELHTLAAAATSDTTTISIPAGAMVLGAAFNVDTAVSDDGGDDTWAAAFVTGDTSTLAAAGTAAAKDTKIETLVAPAITTDVTQIQFTAQGGSFDAGVIDVVAYYIDLTALASAPA